MDLNLIDNVCVITGGSRGIGYATAERMLAEGARVALLGRSSAALETAVETLSRYGEVRAFACDAAEESSVVTAMAAVIKVLGRVDVLVANAGITGQSINLIDMDSAEWDAVHAIDLRGAFLCAREAARAMRNAGTRGRMVLISSLLATVAEPLLGHYNAAKAGVLGLMRSLAVDLAQFGIRVNAVSPGLIDTDQAADYLATGIVPGLLGRAGGPQEIAAAIAFLASDICAFATGSALIVDGGAGIRVSDSPAEHVVATPVGG